MRSTHRFRVEFDFDLHFTRDAFVPDNPVLLDCLPGEGARAARALVYCDDGVVAADPGLPRRIAAWFRAHEGDGVQLAALPETVPGGETAKADLGLVERIARTAAERGVCRHSYILAIGGGAFLDAVGLAAALIHRGVRLVRLPSTVLAQADAGLGVKNGINAFANKNFLGAFAPPFAIVNDAAFLELLDDRGHRSGISEAFKVAIIKDAAFLDWLIAHADDLAARNPEATARCVRRCAELHLDHITGAGDPFERGTSRPLDFGHWSAHRCEILSDHRLNHGEAVAIGIALDLCYARAEGFIDPDLVELVLDALNRLGFALWDEVLDLRDADGRRSVLAGLAQFREHLGGELCLAMPDGAGRRRDIHDFDPERFERCARELRRLAARRRVAGRG